jgi:hypothetical protein
VERGRIVRSVDTGRAKRVKLRWSEIGIGIRAV